LNFTYFTHLLVKKAISERGVIPKEKLGMNEELCGEFVSMTKQRKALAKEGRKTGSVTCLAFYIQSLQLEVRIMGKLHHSFPTVSVPLKEYFVWACFCV
jgi:hypothetical protein